jgi:hypothetical protein
MLKTIKKGIATLFITCLTLLSCNGLNSKDLKKNATLKFEKTLHDFGELSLKNEASVVFKFVNNSEELLQIQEVKTSCGCAAPTWSKEIIKPSNKGEITVTYDSKYPGRFNKTITVFYNGKNSPLELKVKGKVRYPEDSKK